MKTDFCWYANYFVSVSIPLKYNDKKEHIMKYLCMLNHSFIKVIGDIFKSPFTQYLFRLIPWYAILFIVGTPHTCVIFVSARTANWFWSQTFRLGKPNCEYSFLHNAQSENWQLYKTWTFLTSTYNYIYNRVHIYITNIYNNWILCCFMLITFLFVYNLTFNKAVRMNEDTANKIEE